MNRFWPAAAAESAAAAGPEVVKVIPKASLDFSEVLWIRWGYPQENLDFSEESLDFSEEKFGL